jgi:hypothetical protein
MGRWWRGGGGGHEIDAGELGKINIVIVIGLAVDEMATGQNVLPLVIHMFFFHFLCFEVLCTPLPRNKEKQKKLATRKECVSLHPVKPLGG